MGQERAQRWTVGRVAQELGVAPATVRKWEARGLVTAARDWRGGRVFRPDDVQRLRVLAGVDTKSE